MELMTGLNRRLAATICLAALALLLVVSNVHTHGAFRDECGVPETATGASIAGRHGGQNHCAACDIMARGSHISTFVPSSPSANATALAEGGSIARPHVPITLTEGACCASTRGNR